MDGAWQCASFRSMKLNCAFAPAPRKYPHATLGSFFVEIVLIATDGRSPGPCQLVICDRLQPVAHVQFRACAQNHAAELLKKPEEQGLRTEPRSRAVQETRTDIGGETTQGRQTELLTKPRRPRETRKPQSSRWTRRNMHIHAKYRYCIGLHCSTLHGITLHCIA